MALELWEHQKQAAQWIASKDAKALFFEMRVGKTLAAIAGTDGGSRLIVCPNTVKPVWEGDLKLWGQDSYVHPRKEPTSKPRNVIINYESLWRTDLLEYQWDAVIFDESLRLQNPNSKIAQYVLHHLARNTNIGQRLILNGTPCPEGYQQLVCQAIAAQGNYMGLTDPWEAFRAFFVFDSDSYKWVINPGHKKEAQEVLDSLGPRMSQKEAGILTKKLFRSMLIPIGTHELALWDAIDKTANGWNNARAAQAAHSCASGRDPETGVIERSTKLDAVIAYAVELNAPFVIVTHHNSTLEYLRDHLGAEMDVGTICGSDPGTDYRQNLMRKQASGEIQGIIANEYTVSVGVNLSAASTLIFAENNYCGANRIQVEERCTVKGKEAVEIIDFQTEGDTPPGLIDAHVLGAVREKKDFNCTTMNWMRK